MEQELPRVTFILTAFLEGSTVSVVYYFSKLFVQMFPIYEWIKYYKLYLLIYKYLLINSIQNQSLIFLK
jgi:hypothetical protein